MVNVNVKVNDGWWMAGGLRWKRRSVDGRERGDKLKI